MSLGELKYNVVILDEILSQILSHVLLLLLIEIVNHVLEFLSGEAALAG
jgi:hypothetical protein